MIVGLVLWIDLAPSSDGGAGAAGAAEVGLPADAGVAGQHQYPRRDGELHQRGVPDRQPQLRGREARLRRGRRVRRAAQGHQLLRGPDQQRRAGSTAARSTRSSCSSTRRTRRACRRSARTGPRAARRRSPSWTDSGRGAGDDELCITQQGQTPMIAAWTTTSQWTQLGSPYLWWTGPDDAAVLAALVQWGHSAEAPRRLGQGGRGRRRPGRATRTP